MTASGDRLVSLRTSYPDTIVAGEPTVLRCELVRDGVILTPTDNGTFELLDSAGVVFSGAPVIDISTGILSVSLSSTVTAALELGELYQARWSPRLPGIGVGDYETFRREAVVAPFRLVPPIADLDLTRGNYPDLVDQLGGFQFAGAAGESTLQPYIDEAFGWVLRRLFKVGRWPDLLVSTHDVLEVTRERAWFLIFRFLFRSNGGDGSRFERLMEDHGKAAEREWGVLSGRWDKDRDGLADSEDRDPAGAVVHRNAAPRRRLSRSSRW